MSRPVAELESLLQLLITEHEKLLTQVEAQIAAMKRLDAKAMDDAAAAQESTRLRIANLDTRRRTMVNQLALVLRLGGNGPTTLAKVAEAIPQSKTRLLQTRDRLRELVSRVSSRAQVAGKLAGGVLGHLNTVVRLLAGAVEQAGIYTKHGTPKVSPRIGMLETVG